MKATKEPSEVGRRRVALLGGVHIGQDRHSDFGPDFRQNFQAGLEAGRRSGVGWRSGGARMTCGWLTRARATATR